MTIVGFLLEAALDRGVSLFADTVGHGG